MEKVWLTFEDKLINWVDGETDFYDKMEVVKDKMSFPQVNDHVLEEWAKSLISSVFESEDVPRTAKYLLEEIFRQERNFYYRSNGGDEEQESYPMFHKWLHLREKVGRGLKIVLQSISLSIGTYIYLEELYGDEEDTGTESPQVSQAKVAFRLKYDGYIKDIDSFFVLLKTIKPKELKHIFTKCFAKSDVTLKAFFNDCRTIVPERDGERGWNYEAVKKY